MDHAFWNERWQEGRIGFHNNQVHPMLAAQIGTLGLAPGGRVFLPLCGKTVDIGWLLEQDYRVAGVELSRIAVEQLFEELGVEPEISRDGPLTRFSAPGLDVWAGDIFDLSAEVLGPVDAVYDRAALVALPLGMRPRYATHVPAITCHATQLLITFDYDQSVMKGPPFSVPLGEITALYGRGFAISDLLAEPVTGGLKGIAPATEIACLLRAL